MLQQQYAPKQNLIGNIYAVDLIVSSIHFHKRKQELAEEDYSLAVLNHDYRTLQFHQDEKIRLAGKIEGLIESLRYFLAQEADRAGYMVSEEMREFDREIEKLIGGSNVEQ